MDLEVNGTTLFCQVHGAGPPILTMHGGPGLDHSLFRPWLDPLGDTVSLIYHDLRGNGRSSKPASWNAVTHDTWLDDTAALLNVLGHRRAILLGHSYGGYLALEFALKFPDMVGGLVLCNAAPAFDFGDLVVEAARERGTPEQFSALTAGFGAPIPTDEALAATWRSIMPLYVAVPDGAPLQEMMRALERVQFSAAASNRAWFHCIQHFDVRERLPEIKAPALVIAGRHDFVGPLSHGADRLSTGLARAEVEIFEQSGHWPFIEEPERFRDVVRKWCARTLDAARPGA